MRRPHATTIETAAWKPEGWITTKDLIITGKLSCCLIASAFPARFWPAASRLMARAHLWLRSESIHLLEGSNAFSQQDASSMARASIAEDYLSNIWTIRELLPGGRRSQVPLEGREHLDRALQQSRGVVLWSSPFVGSDLATKKALALAGYPLTHLSAPSHPFSPTRVGTKILNPVRLRAVNRYLACRVVVVYGNAGPALAALKKTLAENGVVSIVASGAGKHSLTFPFLGGNICLASGAPFIAHQTGAALVPAFTLPNPKGGYRVALGPDLRPSQELPLQQAVHEMTSRFVELLEPVVRAHPTHWEGWFHPGTWHCSRQGPRGGGSGPPQFPLDRASQRR